MPAGEAKNTYGTGCFVLLNTGPALVHSTHGLISTVAFQLGPTAAVSYALEGSVAIAGAGVAWLKDNLRIIDSARDVEPLARSVPDTAGVCLVPAFAGLFAPHWRDDARVRAPCSGAVEFGLTRFHRAPSLASRNTAPRRTSRARCWRQSASRLVRCLTPCMQTWTLPR